MAQIQKGDTFADGQLVTGARLNQLLDSAILNPEAITGQTYTSTVALGDKFLIYKADGMALASTTLQDIMGVAFPPITTSQVVGNSGLSIGSLALDTVVSGARDTIIGGTSPTSGVLALQSYNDINISSSIGKLNISCPVTFGSSAVSGNITLNGNLVIGSGKTLTLDSAPTSALHAATKAYVDSASPIKASAKFSGATGTIATSKNVTSVSHVATGQYDVVFASAMPNADYIITANCTNNGTLSGWVTIYNQTATGFRAYTAYPVSYGGAQIPYDPIAVFFTVF